MGVKQHVSSALQTPILPLEARCARVLLVIITTQRLARACNVIQAGPFRLEQLRASRFPATQLL